MNKVEVMFCRSGLVLTTSTFPLTDDECWYLFEKPIEDQFDYLYETIFKLNKEAAMILKMKYNRHIISGYNVVIRRIA